MWHSVLVSAMLVQGAQAYAHGLTGGGVAGITIGSFVALLLIVACLMAICMREKRFRTTGLARKHRAKGREDLQVSACTKVDITSLELWQQEVQGKGVSCTCTSPGPASFNIIMPSPQSPRKAKSIIQWLEESQPSGAGCTQCITMGRSDLGAPPLRCLPHRMGRHSRTVSDSQIQKAVERVSLLPSGPESARYPHDPWKDFNMQEPNLFQTALKAETASSQVQQHSTIVNQALSQRDISMPESSLSGPLPDREQGPSLASELPGEQWPEDLLSPEKDQTGSPRFPMHTRVQELPQGVLYTGTYHRAGSKENGNDT